MREEKHGSAIRDVVRGEVGKHTLCLKFYPLCYALMLTKRTNYALFSNLLCYFDIMTYVCLRRKNPFNLAEADCTSVRTRCISSTCAFSTTHVKFNDVIVHI